ncbi:hypothetical protein ACOMHN_035526 [Nucella lapillus]
MSYPWFVGASNSVAGLDNVPQNGSLTHSPAALAAADSPGTSSHAVAPSGGFPSTSPYPALSATASQHSSESQSQSPHGLPPNPSSFLPGFGENTLPQHLYPGPSRFGPFNTDGVPSSEQNFASTFGMSPQMLSQSYSNMRSQTYAGVTGYRDPSQQEMARLSAYGASAYATPGFDSYYAFDNRASANQSAANSMLSAADRMIKGDPFENGVPRAGMSPWSQFGADGREGLYLQPGYATHPAMSPYGPTLSPMFHPSARYRTMGYDGTSFRPDLADPYGIASSAQHMMYMDRKSPKTKDLSPGMPTPNPNDSPPVPNKASKYFSQRGIFVFRPPDTNAPIGPYSNMMLSLADRYILCQKVLCQRLADVDLPPKVTYVYNPLEYAFDTHYKFVKKYYNSSKRILFLGMNPGPFGMSQNGVPFGECNIVTDWMEIDGEVLKPVLEHPKRPVMGMECKRSEVSGARFWELFRRLCPTAESFFKNCAIHNLCPLAFMTETGKNVAPSDMPVKVLRQLDSLCDQTFLDVVALFKIEHVITVGKYAFTCAQKALTTHSVHGVQLHCMMHPSPANPSANKGWTDIAENQLREFGVYNIIAVNPQPPRQPPQPSPKPQPEPEPEPQPQPQPQQQQPQQQAPQQQQQQQPPPQPHQTPPHHQQSQQQQQHQHPHQPTSQQPEAVPVSQEPQLSSAQQQALHSSYQQMMSHYHPQHHHHPSSQSPAVSYPSAHPGYPPSNPYLHHHHSPYAAHMGAAHHHPSPYSTAPHHHPHHPQSYSVPHVLQSTGGMNPLPIGMGGGEEEVGTCCPWLNGPVTFPPLTETRFRNA